MKKENGLKTFFRTTYQTGSPIPYILSIQISLFILIHIADLLVELEVIQFPLYDWTVQHLGLPNNLLGFETTLVISHLSIPLHRPIQYCVRLFVVVLDGQYLSKFSQQEAVPFGILICICTFGD